MNRARKIGNRIAPLRFIAYALALILSGIIAAMQRDHMLEVFLVGFNISTFLFLASLLPLFRLHRPEDISRHATDNDANRVALLVITLSIIAVILGALVLVVTGKGDYSKLLVVVTLALCWLFANVIYALHYAHLYYSPGTGQGGYAGGLSIPSTDKPDYRDFFHFSLILGMTFQTADIDITSTKIRRVSTWQCLESFIFNICIIAFTINMLGNS